MNPYEFNTLFLEIQMEIYDLEKQLETLQLGKDDNEKKELKIKGIQEELNEKNKEMQNMKKIQLETEKFLKESNGMNPYEFNTLFLEIQMEIYDLEKQLETLQLGKDDNEEKELKIKKIQKKLDEKNKKMQIIEKEQLGIVNFLKKHSVAYWGIQIIPSSGENWEWRYTLDIEE